MPPGLPQLGSETNKWTNLNSASHVAGIQTKRYGSIEEEEEPTLPVEGKEASRRNGMSPVWTSVPGVVGPKPGPMRKRQKMRLQSKPKI